MTTSPPSLHKPDNRLVAERNELAVLTLVRDYGHVRRTEVARAIWPKSPPRVADRMVSRTVKRLLEKQCLQDRPNSLGGRSLVLTSRGATWLRRNDIQAQDGYDLSSVAGPQFYHRTLGTRYLIERTVSGHRSYGEYAITKGWGPIGRGELGQRFAKIPDGLVLVPGQERGYDKAVCAADWVEVESSYKPEKELDRIFSLAWKVGSWLNAAETVLLDRVLFVYDARQRHENMILGALKRYLAAHPVTNADLLKSILLVRCDIKIPLVWGGHEELESDRLLKLRDSTDSETDE